MLCSVLSRAQQEQDEHDEVIVRSMMHAVMSSRYALTYADVCC
jgi:hypothetical protein